MAATPPQAFHLDRTLFNQTLYSQLRTLWYAGTPEGATVPPMEVLQRMFGGNRTQEQKDAFDDECRALAGPALDSIAPSKLSLPPFKSYEDEIENAGTLCAPFLAEVKDAQQEDDKKGAETVLGLLLLLDQMPRNLFRTPDELPLVYKHYDRLAYALVRSTLALSPRPMEHPAYLLPMYWMFELLPLQHSEHLPSHELADKMADEWREKFTASAVSDEAAVAFAQRAKESQEQHKEPLRRFGRYVHRNECLGRQNTPEEDEFLKTAPTFGVKQTKKQQQEAKTKDEL